MDGTGRLQPIIDTVYPLEEGVQSLRRLQEGDVAGKLVLRPLAPVPVPSTIFTSHSTKSYLGKS